MASRTRDIGICLALGAPRGRVLRSEIWSALRVVAIGIAIGIPASIASSTTTVSSTGAGTVAHRAQSYL